MTTNRRTFIAGSLAATAATAVPLRDAMAQQELKLASFVPPTHVDLDRRASRLDATRSRSCSNNQLTVRLFPAMQLGGKPPELYRQVVQGISDIDLHAAGLHVGRLPDDGADRIAGHRQQRRGRHAQALGSTSTSILARDFKGTKVLMLWNSDAASLMSQGEADPHARRHQGHEDPHAVGRAVRAARGARRDADRYAGEPDLQQPRPRRDRRHA